MSATEWQDIYGKLISQGLRVRLFEFDQVLVGAGCPFRLKPWQYGQAREAIVTLYHIVKHPDLDATPLARAVAKAKADPRFQCFMGATVQRRPRRSR